MFVAIMAFFARISDPAVGGTYMTLLNTLTNLGGNWPATLALWAVDHLTWKRCQFDLKDVKSSNIRYIFPTMFSQSELNKNRIDFDKSCSNLISKVKLKLDFSRLFLSF